MRKLEKIGVLDDERIAVDGLVYQLKKLVDGVDVHGFMYAQPFVEWCKECKPGLVFLDMEMPGALGLDVAKEIQFHVGNIVFVTAHSEYSLEAFDTAVDYILKPVSPSRLSQSLNKIAALSPAGLFKERHIKIPIKGSFHTISEARINILLGQRNYTEVILDSGERHLVARTLKNFEESLSERFSRVHKSVIVRRDAVERIEWGTKILFHVKGGSVLEASRTRINQGDWPNV
jgi:DNA-binding LytR/AlgR family response regulator